MGAWRQRASSFNLCLLQHELTYLCINLFIHPSMYSNLLLKFALWIGAVGAHLVGKCVLYSYRFWNPLIQRIAIGNGWNLRQLAWPKPNDVKLLQSWASQTCRAIMRWGGSMKSLKVPSRKSGTIGRTCYNEIQPIKTFVEFESATVFKGFETLHNNVLDIDDQLLCSDVQTEARHMYDELRRSFELFQRNVNKLSFNVKHKKSMHSWQMTLHDMFKQ